MERDWTAIGRRVRELRREQGLTQEDLARRGDTYRPLVARIERGTHVPSLDTLGRYADALGCSVAGLLRGVESAQGQEAAE